MIWAQAATENPFNWSLLIQLVGFFIIVASAAVWLKSSLVKQRHMELEELADTRGKTIEDLKNKVASLESEMATLRGQMQALQGLKATEIADEVVARLSKLQGI